MAQNVIAIASDHAGFEVKDALKVVLIETGYAICDLGTNGRDTVDYPDYADALTSMMANGKVKRGVLLCGSGIGMSIAANRKSFIRAALCHSVTDARLARQHNDANVLVFGSRIIGIEIMKDCLSMFLNTPFEGGRHLRRVNKIS